MLNDADQRPVAPGLVEAGEKYGREDFIHAGTNGQRGRPPEHTSLRFPWVRRAFMRSGWEAEALYGFLETAPFGYGHQHEDALTFEIAAFGRPLIGTMGRYTYAGVPKRRYLTGSRGHNVVLIDGQGQAMRSLREIHNRPAPAPEGWLASGPTQDPWVSTKDLDVAYGKYSGPWSDGLKGVTWERRMAFQKPGPGRPGLFVIRDAFAGGGTHDLDLLLHFFPGEVAWDEGAGQVWSDYGPGQGNILVQFLDPAGLSIDAAKGQEDPPRGWFSVEYGMIEPAWEVSARRRAPFPAAFTMALVPFRGGRRPEVSAKALDGGAEVTVDGKSYKITW
jgi:hypothetical protein